MRRMVLAGVVAVMAAAGVASGAEWQPKQAPLMTKWAKDVRADRVLPEYPRPQMARDRWLNLNGVWEFARATEGEKAPVGGKLAGRILVPFPVESALSGVMEQAERVWYRRTFAVPKEWGGQRVLLHFGAVDWEATVWVNGKEVGTHRGGYDPFSFDVTDALKPEGEQEVVVGVYDPTDAGDQPRGKQVKEPRGIFYTPTTGIWQTVWLEPVPRTYIPSIKVVPDVDGKCVRVTTPLENGNDNLTINVRVLSGGKTVGLKGGHRGEEIVVPLEDARLWSPEDPFLYDLRVSVGKDLDAVRSYFGMRKVEVAKDAKGTPRILLNGKDVFQVGMLDQGFWPDGLYTAPTDEALRFDIQVQKDLGFNLIRKHVKVEPARWYYWCDKLGVLVWQDMPHGNNRTDESKKQYELELTRMIESFGNHPSIIMWVVFNEAWGQYDTARVTKLAEDLDPTRLVNNASGWTDAGVGDVVDAHVYPGPGMPTADGRRAAVLGEFGGLGLAMPGHLWWERNFSYSGQESPEELVRQYTRLLGRAWQFRESEGLCAAVYTQTTDVEGEINGLMTYDRVLKADAAALRKANLGQTPQIEVQTLVPSAQQEAAVWRYTFTAPAGATTQPLTTQSSSTTQLPAEGGAWTKPGFDDEGWKQGPGGFGTEGTPGAVVRTNWSTSDVWLRREVELPADVDARDLNLWLHHDEDCEVYINGVLAARKRRYRTEYQETPIRPDAAAALRPGAKNTIAVHCRNTIGGQYVDVGIVRVTERPKAP